MPVMLIFLFAEDSGTQSNVLEQNCYTSFIVESNDNYDIVHTYNLLVSIALTLDTDELPLQGHVQSCKVHKIDSLFSHHLVENFPWLSLMATLRQQVKHH